jgi:hypothetical protein
MVKLFDDVDGVKERRKGQRFHILLALGSRGSLFHHLKLGVGTGNLKSPFAHG